MIVGGAHYLELFCNSEAIYAGYRMACLGGGELLESIGERKVCSRRKSKSKKREGWEKVDVKIQK